MYTVYKVINDLTNETIYIGMTKDSIDKRMVKHISTAIVDESDTNFSKAIREIGYKNLTIEPILDNIMSREEACVEERKYIEKYDTMNNGYNTTSGGMGKFVFYPSTEREISLKYANGESIEELVKEYNSNTNTIKRVLNRCGFINPSNIIDPDYSPFDISILDTPWKIVV